MADVKVQVQRICFEVTNPITVDDNRDGGKVTLAPGKYMAHPQLRENMTLYYIYVTDNDYVSQGYPVVHSMLRVDDDSNVVFDW